MAIKITDVERIGEVAADPAFVANFGFLYTKDALGITQLFYETDAGTVYQLTPAATPGDTPWLRTGTVVALDQTGDTEVNPFDDNSTDFGTSTKRWLNVRTGSNGLSVFSTSGAANRTAFFGSAGLSWGVGGATALDAGLARIGVARIAVTSGDGGGSGGLFPNVDGSGTAVLGDSTLRWRSITGNSHFVFGTAADAQPTSRMGSAFLTFGPGGITAPDVGIARSATSVNTIEVTDGAAASGNVQPLVTDTGSVGTSGATGKTWGSVKSGQGGHSVYAAAADANAQATLGGNAAGGQIQMGAGGATALDTRIRRTSAITMTVDDNTAAGRVEIVPALDGTNNAVGSFLGTAALRFSQVNAFEVNTGDIVFTDEACAVCGHQFEEGDDLVMRVIKIHEGPHGRRARTVPAHHSCR